MRIRVQLRAILKKIKTGLEKTAYFGQLLRASQFGVREVPADPPPFDYYFVELRGTRKYGYDLSH